MHRVGRKGQAGMSSRLDQQTEIRLQASACLPSDCPASPQVLPDTTVWDAAGVAENVDGHTAEGYSKAHLT